MLEQLLSLRLAAPAGLLNPAEEAADLSQGLLLARFENPLQTAELFLVAHNRPQDVVHPRRGVGQDHDRGLAGRF